MTTQLEDIKKYHSILTETFANSPRSKDESIELLKKFRNKMSLSFDIISDAIKQDFNKPKEEVYITEFSEAIAEMSHIISNLNSMLISKPTNSLPISFSTLNTKIEKIALGTILIISPFNYPLILAVSPLVGAIASGNNVVLKLPYDQLPNFSNELKKVIESVFPKDQVMVVNGGIPESEFLLYECKFDKIFFTGSTNVGKLVYKAASEKLTPVVLELGGKSPVFITKNINLNSIDILIDRLLWGKFTNSGQTCVAPDYLLIDESVYEPVIKSLLKRFNITYSKIDKDYNFSHIINEKGFDRLNSSIKETKGSILAGGNSDKKSLFIQPTLVTDIEWDDPLMVGELFGPVLPIIKYNSSLKEIVKKVALIHDCPLATYVFSDSENDLNIIKQFLRSGSISINETLMAAGCFVTPFGGIGNSGFGNYHSKWSIDAFTHERAILKQPLWAETLLKARYIPYTQSNLKSLKMLENFPEIPVERIKKSIFVVLIFFLGWILGKIF